MTVHILDWRTSKKLVVFSNISIYYGNAYRSAVILMLECFFGCCKTIFDSISSDGVSCEHGDFISSPNARFLGGLGSIDLMKNPGCIVACLVVDCSCDQCRGSGMLWTNDLNRWDLFDSEETPWLWAGRFCWVPPLRKRIYIFVMISISKHYVWPDNQVSGRGSLPHHFY